MEKKSERKWKPQTAGTLASLKFLGLPFFSFPRASAPVKRGCPCADEGRTGWPRPRMGAPLFRASIATPRKMSTTRYRCDRTGLATLAKSPSERGHHRHRRLRRGAWAITSATRPNCPKEPRVSHPCHPSSFGAPSHIHHPRLPVTTIIPLLGAQLERPVQSIVASPPPPPLLAHHPTATTPYSGGPISLQLGVRYSLREKKCRFPLDCPLPLSPAPLVHRPPPPPRPPKDMPKTGTP